MIFELHDYIEFYWVLYYCVRDLKFPDNTWSGKLFKHDTPQLWMCEGIKSKGRLGQEISGCSIDFFYRKTTEYSSNNTFYRDIDNEPLIRGFEYIGCVLDKAEEIELSIDKIPQAQLRLFKKEFTNFKNRFPDVETSVEKMLRKIKSKITIEQTVTVQPMRVQTDNTPDKLEILTESPHVPSATDSISQFHLAHTKIIKEFVKWNFSKGHQGIYSFDEVLNLFILSQGKLFDFSKSDFNYRNIIKTKDENVWKVKINLDEEGIVANCLAYVKIIYSNIHHFESFIKTPSEDHDYQIPGVVKSKDYLKRSAFYKQLKLQDIIDDHSPSRNNQINDFTLGFFADFATDLFDGNEDDISDVWQKSDLFVDLQKAFPSFDFRSLFGQEERVMKITLKFENNIWNITQAKDNEIGRKSP